MRARAGECSAQRVPLPVFDVTFIGTPFFMQLIIVDTGLSTPWQVSLSNLGTAILGS